MAVSITSGIAVPKKIACRPRVILVVAVGVAVVALLVAVIFIVTTVVVAASKQGHGHARERKERRGGLTDQLVLQLLAASRRPPSPVIADSCGERGESCAFSSDGSTQPLTSESIIARWTSIAYRARIDLVNAL